MFEKGFFSHFTEKCCIFAAKSYSCECYTYRETDVDALRVHDAQFNIVKVLPIHPIWMLDLTIITSYCLKKRVDRGVFKN